MAPSSMSRVALSISAGGMSENRPSWDSIWMKFAFLVAERSYDPRHQVGAVIINDDNTQVLAIGYNGNFVGGPHTPDSIDPGKSGFIHAEINALLKMDFHFPVRKKMYVTLSPCLMCAKAIINAGIDEVVYKDAYRILDGINLLTANDITVRRFG